MFSEARSSDATGTVGTRIRGVAASGTTRADVFVLCGDGRVQPQCDVSVVLGAGAGMAPARIDRPGSIATARQTFADHGCELGSTCVVAHAPRDALLGGMANPGAEVQPTDLKAENALTDAWIVKEPPQSRSAFSQCDIRGERFALAHGHHFEVMSSVSARARAILLRL